jgi:putative transposase
MKIRSRIVRGIVTWSHFRFRQSVLAKVHTYSGCRIVIYDEAYTSRTCGKCGQLNHKLGAHVRLTIDICRTMISIQTYTNV